MEDLDQFTTKVPFKINVWEGQVRAKPGYQNFVLDTGFDSLNRYFKFLTGGKSFGVKFFEYNGWKQNDNLARPHRGIYVDTLINGIYRVHYVNESSNSHSGHEKTCFFSKRLDDLEKFCVDWNFDKSLINLCEDVVHYF